MSIQKDAQQALQYAFSRGWITRRDGNISVRKDNCFFITPSGVDKTSNFEIVRGELTPDLDNIDFPTKTIPSIELDMHIFTHKFKLDLPSAAVVHIHPTYTIAAIRRGINLQEISKEFPELNRYTKVGQTVKFYNPGSSELAIDTANSLRFTDVCGIYNHGVTAVAETINEAMEHIERLEHICQIILASKQC